MASSILLFFFSTVLLYASTLFLFLLHPTLAVIIIPLGSSLTPTEKPTSWLSPSGLFAFGFYRQGDGFAVGIWLERSPGKTVVWTANRDNPPVPSSTKLLLTDRGLLLRTPGSPDSLISGDISQQPAACKASMLDSGNLVLCDSKSSMIWESFSSPTDTILGGQKLLLGNQLISSRSDTNHSTGRFLLAMQEDGNLVFYPVGGDGGTDAYWATCTNGNPNIDSLFLNVTGSISLLNSRCNSIKDLLAPPSRSSRFTIYRATVDTDGFFRRYSHNFEMNDSTMETSDVSQLSNKCLVKGICGINSYCTLMDVQTVCFCLPGYEFINPDQQFMGCFRNYSDEDCIQKEDRKSQYSMSPIKDVVWLDSFYESLQSNNEEDCGDKCLRDCNCEATVFVGKTCKKMRFPLKNGRRDPTASGNTTLIKLGNGSHAISIGNVSHVTENRRQKDQHLKEILIVIVTLATALIFILTVTILLIQRRMRRYRKLSEERDVVLSEEIVLRSYSYKELQKATRDFSEELGKGAFGRVYKGAISRGTRIIAVKRLEKVEEEGEREFRAEVRAIGRTHHRNLVQLIGFCDEGSSRLLVYEYMSNGSLADLLFKADRQPGWNERVGIAVDVARGIRYLHEDCLPHIIHCDIKPQNILMDDSWTAKISDFGLAKLLMPNQTRTFTGIRGTRGYLAPEWYKNTPISVKTDVYSYGIVLLEIICCRRNIEVEVPDDQIILHEWVYDCLNAGKLSELLEEEEVEVRMLNRMVKVGLWCIQNEPHLRPSMKNVILMLEGIMDIPIPPSPTSSTMSN